MQASSKFTHDALFELFRAWFMLKQVKCVAADQQLLSRVLAYQAVAHKDHDLAARCGEFLVWIANEHSSIKTHPLLIAGDLTRSLHDAVNSRVFACFLSGCLFFTLNRRIFLHLENLFILPPFH